MQNIEVAVQPKRVHLRNVRHEMNAIIGIKADKIEL